MADDRATREFFENFFSEPGSGPSIPPVPAEPAPRTSDGSGSRRQLRATFRPTPAESTGFPGTKAFSARRTDRRAAGTTVQSKAIGPDGPPARSPRADDSQGRRAPLLEAGRGSQAHQPAQSEDAGGVRRRRSAGARTTGRTAGPAASSTKQTQASGVAAPIANAIPIGTRVTVTDPSHPWHTYAGAVISDPEKYGLGWFGQRLELDGNNGEAFVRPEQTDWKKPRRAAALPAAIAKLVPKSDEPKSQPKLIPTENERASATRLFREIGQRFNENRKKSKTAAYAGFRHDLMDNLDTLVMGGAIDLKEATSIITNLEQYTKETEAESTETPATILGRWLRMDAAEVAGLVPVEETVEDEENLEEDSGEEVEQSEIFI